jgi:hypothetical protein
MRTKVDSHEGSLLRAQGFLERDGSSEYVCDHLNSIRPAPTAIVKCSHLAKLRQWAI